MVAASGQCCDFACRQTHAADDCRQRWQIQLDRTQIIELESSTPAKWSRHLIVWLPGCGFKHNGHMGRFVEALLDAQEVRFA